jgi:O-antigen ligase
VAVSLASGPLAPSLRKARAAALTTRISLPSAVLALAVPPLFLHVDWQPGVSVGVGSTSVGIELSDLAVLAVVATAVVIGYRDGFAAVRRTWPIWAALAALAVWIAAATLYGPLVLDGYPTAENLVTAAKFTEYALLAPAVAVLARDPADLGLPLVVLVLWCAAASVVGLVQFLGADVLDAWTPGHRQPSFLGHHDFAALAGGVLLLGLVWVVLGCERRWLRATALAAGAVGLVLAAAVASVLGLLLAGLLLGAVGLRERVPVARLAAASAVLGAVAIGVLALRGGDVADFLRFAQDEPTEPTQRVETYSHRTLLAYIGGRIFLDHPLAGVGWQGSSEPAAFEPYLADAHRRFPDTAPLAFPAPDRRHGVQNAYVQTLSDLGIVGLALLAALGVATVWHLRRVLLRSRLALVGALWLLLAAGLWTAQGLVTGIPLAALTWIALGLVAAADGSA